MLICGCLLVNLTPNPRIFKMASRRLGGKRKANPSGSSHPSSTPTDPEFPGIIFRDEYQREKFTKLKLRKVNSTCFICPDTLHELGIYDQMRYIFNSLKLNAFFEMRYETSMS